MPFRQFGGLSLLFRQTNVVWLAFIASTAMARRLRSRTSLNDPSLRTATFSACPSCSSSRNDPRLTVGVEVDIPGSMFSLIVSSITNISSLLPIILAYLPVFVAAGSFVYQNGGIVLGKLDQDQHHSRHATKHIVRVGDKQNHVSTLHIPQLYYFVAFTATFLSPSILSLNSLRSSVLALYKGKRRIIISLTLMAIMCWTIKHYTFVLNVCFSRSIMSNLFLALVVSHIHSF